MRHEQRLLTITGVRGIGKTVLAEAVADACSRTGLVKRVIQIGVTAETNFDRVLDAIAMHTNKPYLVELDYRNKYVSIEQILETETSLLILDQQEAGAIFSGEFRDRVKALSEHATVIVCSHEAWDDVYDVALQPLDSGAASNLYNVNTSDKLESRSDTEALLALTEGVPLALKLFRQAKDSSKLTFHEAIAQIGSIEADNQHGQVISQHERILEWCWTLLVEPSRRILASLIDFDLLEGVDADWLCALHSDLPRTVIEKILPQLEMRGLIEARSTANGATTYHWHSLIGEFLSSIDALARTDAMPDFKAHLQGHFCQLHFDYATQFADDYSRLDLRQRTLLHAFDLGFNQGMITLAQVNRFLPYLIARGLYDSARRVINRTAQHLADHSVGTVELLLNSARLDSKQGEFDAAERQINEALVLADELGSTSYRDELYNQLGIIVKNRGQFEQASQIHKRALEYARESQNRA